MSNAQKKFDLWAPERERYAKKYLTAVAPHSEPTLELKGKKRTMQRHNRKLQKQVSYDIEPVIFLKSRHFSRQFLANV